MNVNCELEVAMTDRRMAVEGQASLRCGCGSPLNKTHIATMVNKLRLERPEITPDPGIGFKQ